MATYAIGDLHGCFPELKRLLAKIAFNPHQDTLWFVGDLLSRGPDSLGCLRFIRHLGNRAVAVMGNHEVRAIMGLSGNGTRAFHDYMDFFAEAPDRAELYGWIRSLPLIHRDQRLGFTMVHAGLHPLWSVEDGLERAACLGEIFADENQTRRFFSKPYNKPVLEEPDRSDRMAWLHFALGLMTKIRYCTRDGRLISPKEVRESRLLGDDGHPPKDSPYQAWHHHRPWQPGERIIYGHWAMAGLTRHRHSFGLDSGAVYGGKLTAMQLDHPDHPIFQVSSKPYVVIDNLTPARMGLGRHECLPSGFGQRSKS
ncbi:MAG: symmetrical bis(5'-nucleosyl)-tetraphosphatase [Magnetococcales bacterium]|nr:symmetrical bis(5'-nucleosyl)-tetraphosphatase [Magnetococcales bacterium]